MVTHAAHNRVAAIVHDDAEGAGDGFLGLGAGQGGIGIADAHGKTEAEGVGEADPCGGVTAVHEIVVLQELGTGSGHFLQDGDGLVQFAQELGVNLVERVVEVGELAKVGVGDGTVVVCYLMHGGHFEHLGKRQLVDHIQFQGFFLEVLVTAHTVFVLDGEHAAVPAVVYIPTGVVTVGEGGSHISAPGLGAEVIHDLVVGIQIGSVAEDDDRALQLLEHAAEGQTVLSHLLVGHSVLVFVDVLESFGAGGEGSSGGKGDDCFENMFHIHGALVI